MAGGHCVFVGEDDGIRQGDIILQRRINDAQVVGVIVTADCDIVQTKSGGLLTWLEIVPSYVYLESTWAPEQLRRLAQKNIRSCCDRVNGLLAATNFGTLSEASLVQWLRDEVVDEIANQLSKAINRPLDSALLNSLAAIALAIDLGSAKPAFTRLREAWALLGRAMKNQQAAVREVFDSDRGFPDYVLIPDLPSVDGIGHAVLLRAISSLEISDLFVSETEARASGHNESFFRIGRFNDTTRFAIAQKLAFLFSRIGMPSSFENECDTATELLLEQVYGEAYET